MKVLVFGTFDIFHKGHEYFLKKAKELGTEMFIVVARDNTVKDVKKEAPKNDELLRLKTLKKYGIGKVILGNLSDDKYQIIESIKPDIIALGYDQSIYTKNLLDELTARNLSCKIVRIDSYKPSIYKSSKLK